MPAPSESDAKGQFDPARNILDDVTPNAFASAVAQAEGAAAKGSAEAALQLANLEAVGFRRPRSWQKAFELLRQAASLGSADAAEQLELLACDDPDERLFAVPARVALADSPRIRLFREFASPAICDRVVDRFRESLSPAMVWDAAAGTPKVDAMRTNRTRDLLRRDMDVVLAVLRARISAATRLPEEIFETAQVMRYEPGQEFKLHHDYLDPLIPGQLLDMERRGQRIGTVLIYLNDDFEAGETEFPFAGIKLRGKKGDALFFTNVTPTGEPDVKALHSGNSPTSGEKWIFSQWIRDRQQPGA